MTFTRCTGKYIESYRYTVLMYSVQVLSFVHCTGRYIENKDVQYALGPSAILGNRLAVQEDLLEHRYECAVY